MQTRSGSSLMGIAYLVLVALIILFCAARSNNFDDYAKYFGLFGTLVGVATGAIPSFFFKAQAEKATDLAGKASDRADKESAKAQVYAGALEPQKVNDVKQDNPGLFQ